MLKTFKRDDDMLPKEVMSNFSEITGRITCCDAS